VHLPMVEIAQRDEIAEVRLAAVGPMLLLERYG
jgi:hypothetical protein